MQRGTVWRTTAQGWFALALVVIGCGDTNGSAEDTSSAGDTGNTTASEDGSGGTANTLPATSSGGTAGTGLTPSTSAGPGSGGQLMTTPVAYADCSEGGGGCSGDDPLCVDAEGVVATVTGAGATSMRFEVCTRACEADSDCLTDLDTDAPGRCIELGGQNVCVLDCSAGHECPEGMSCSWQDNVCMYDRYCGCSDNCVIDNTSTVTCTGDCFGQLDVTCTKSCDDAAYSCVKN